MVTATAKSKGTTTWDVWRQTHAALQGRKSKPVVNTADKFVKKHDLQHFVHRTTLSGCLYTTDLKTGEERIVNLKHSAGVKSKLTTSLAIAAHNTKFIGIDRPLQLALTKKFYKYEFTFEELLYCQENPKFTERLLDGAISDTKLGSHWPYDFYVNIEQLVDNPSLLEPLPGESNYVVNSTVKSYSESVQDLLNEFFQLDYQREIDTLDDRHTEMFMVNYIRRYALERMRKYLIWGDLLNRQLVSVDVFKERHNQGTL